MKPIITFLIAVSLVFGSTIVTYSQNPQQLYQKALVKEEGEGALLEAISLYNQVADNSNAGNSLQAKALLHVGLCYEKMGKQEALKAYQRLVNDFPGEKNEVAVARERLNKLIQVEKAALNTIPEPKFTKIKMPGNPGNGVLSPDGKKIVFIKDGSVWVMPTSGGVDPYIAGESLKLTDNIGAWDMSNSFCWSGNGKWIAFNAKLKSSSTSVYIVSSDGSQLQKVNIPSHVCGWPQEFRLSLSYDGRTLAYATGYKPGDWQNKFTRIYTIPVKGGEAKELTEQGTQEPAFSPDGNKIAFVKCYKDSMARYHFSNIWVVPSKGGTPVKVSNFQSGQVSGPVWSHDGKMIAFLKRPEGKDPKEAWIVSVTEEGVPSAPAKKIELPLASFHALAGWTPDNKIGIQLMNPEFEIIYTVPSSGGIATQVTPKGWTSYPKWSPDGGKIFFRWDGGQIASVPSGGGPVDSIKIDSEFDIFTAVPGSGNEVSPDGKTIVFSGCKIFYEDGVRKWDVNIYTIPIDGGKPAKLTEVAVELQDRFPCWSPDGSSIAFIRPEIKDGKHIMHIYTVSKDGKNLNQISSEEDNIMWAPIDWTPDGKYITFFTNSSTIRSIPIEGNRSVLVTKVDSVNNQFELAWSPNGKELAYTDQGKIWIYNKEVGTTQEVKTGVKASATKIGWSPDGKKIAFTAYSGGDAELWVMENFLPFNKQAKNEQEAIMLQQAEKHFQEGNRLFGMWEYEAAIKEYEAAVKIAPNTLSAQNAQYYIGQSRFKLGNYDKSLITFKKLIKENPTSNIVPVAELMIEQVEHVLENNKLMGVPEISGTENTVVDPATGITYNKLKTFAGKNDLIKHTGGFNLSPDARFVVLENKVVPLDGSDPFNLVDMDALRAVYSPNIDKACFYADSAIWIVPVSPLTGKANGKPKKMLEGSYTFQHVASWSPDGEKIAFVRRDATVASDIWTLSIDDGKLVPVTNQLGVEHSPAWAPDGSSIIYRKDNEIWLAPTNGDEKRMLLVNGGYPMWSPDSKWLFHSNWENHHLFSMEQNKNLKFDMPEYIGKIIGFSANREKVLLYRSSFFDNWGLKVVSALGGPSFKPALNSPVYGSWWSTDGNYILTQGDDENGDMQFRIVPLSGGNYVPIKMDVDIEGKPFPFTFSPDFTQLAFSVKRDEGYKDIYVMPFSIQEARTKGKARLVFKEWTGGAYNVTFNWAKDGSKIALIHKGDIWNIPLNGEKPKQLTNTPEKERWVNWTPDGKLIGYIIPRGAKREMYVAPSNGGTPRLIHKDFTTWNWSPDGNNAAILTNNEIQIINVTDAKISQHLLNIKDLGLTDTSSPRYSPDGKFIAFIGINKDDTSIYIYSLERKSYTRIAFDVLDDYKYGLRWSPDGKWLSYLTYEQEKVRPEGILWEADFEEVKEKLISQNE